MLNEVSAEKQLASRFRTRVSPFIKKHALTLSPGAAEALLQQFRPDARELIDVEGYNDDPLHEEDADIHPFQDVVHKYPNKILYLTTDECPVYCRYCTRKRKTLLSTGHVTTPLIEILAYLRKHPLVNEVIFSGGDPLMLSPSKLTKAMDAFLSLDQLLFLRLHTRALTTSPALFSESLLSSLQALQSKFQQKMIVFVLHINISAELSDAAINAAIMLQNTGIRLYAQTVLLAGINDDARILAELCTQLSRKGIQPYYLHQLDRVTGAAHFAVNDDRAIEIYENLKTLIPPYMLPRMVRDSKQGKKPLSRD
jgi:L-lysine 2,3-aminomutase